MTGNQLAAELSGYRTNYDEGRVKNKFSRPWYQANLLNMKEHCKIGTIANKHDGKEETWISAGHQFQPHRNAKIWNHSVNMVGKTKPGTNLAVW